MAIDNIEIIKANCNEFVRIVKSKDVLRNADGKNHYTKIASLIGIHQTTVSGILKKAEKFGLAKKIKPGIYKKLPGVLGFMPKNNSKHATNIIVDDLTKKIFKTKSFPKTKFPAGLVIQSKIITSLDKMVAAYQSLYATENALRELIRKGFDKQDGWWNQKIPSGVKTAVQKNIDEMLYHASKRSDELEYTHLGQLKEIIVNGKNWDLFSPFLKTKDKNDFSATINKAIASRNAIGHCIPLNPNDLKIVDIRFRDILDMIK